MMMKRFPTPALAFGSLVVLCALCATGWLTPSTPTPIASEPTYLAQDLPPYQDPTPKTYLPTGHVVRIRLDSELRATKLEPGDTVSFKVVKDIYDQGQLLVAAGSTGAGEITTVYKPDLAGEPAQFTISNLWLTTVKGGRIWVLGSITQRGDRRHHAPGVARSVLWYPLVFVKDPDAIIPAGAEEVVTVEDDQIMTPLN